MRERVSREEWAKRVEMWVRSGKTAGEFCAEHGWNVNSLKNWKSVLKRASATRKVEKSKKKVAFAQAVTAVEPFVVVVGRHQVRVPAAFEPAVLQQILDVLEAR